MPADGLAARSCGWWPLSNSTRWSRCPVAGCCPGGGHRASARGAADYADPQALGAALRDVDTLVFVSSDGPVAEVMVHQQNVIRAAGDSGVTHIVALSGLDTDLSPPFCYAVSYGYTERLLAESGCAVSIARASIYSEFFVGFLARAAPAANSGFPPLTAGYRSSRAAASRGAWQYWPWRLREVATTTSPGPSPWIWMPSQPRARRSGAPRSSTSTSHPASTACRWQPPGRIHVDVCILDDVRVDSRTALGGGLRWDPSPDRTLSNASPHRARPLQGGLMERDNDCQRRDPA